jgi:DnaJ-class molecular chaperone
MAGERREREDSAPGDAGTDGSHEPRECMACGGKGQVISNLGGSPSRVSCPWCGGTGVRPEDVDAQARWLAQKGDPDAATEQPPPEAAA